MEVMPSPTNIGLIRGSENDPNGTERLGQAIEVLQARIAEEFQVSERINTKGRQAFALLTAFFAIAQTIAFGGFGLSHPQGATAVLLAIVATFAIVALLVSGHRVLGLEELQPEAYLKPEKVVQWAKAGPDRAFAQQAIVNMAEIADRRRKSNEKRAEQYRELESSARLVVVLIAAEILIAIIFCA